MSVGRSALASIAAASACGALVGYFLAPQRDPVPGSAPATQARSLGERDVRAMSVAPVGPSAADYRALERELENERALREALEAKLAPLIESPLDSERAIPDDRAMPHGTASVQFAHVPPGPADSNLEVPMEAREWFNRDALVTAGLSNSEIREIEERWEEHEMQKLYLTDEATREGTVQTRDFYEQLTALDRGVREDLGPEAYDAYLFATGNPNRVVLKQVLENSPAGYAGLEAGDIVIRYAGERVFHGIDFKSATNQGEAGTATSLEVLRDGQIRLFSVPRGPLGVQLNPHLAPPEKNL